MKKYFFFVLAAAISAFSLTNCTEKTEVENVYYITNYGDSVPTGKVVNSVPTQILSFEDAKLLQSGTSLKLRINRTGTEVKEYDITFDGTYEMNGERLIFCSTPSNLIVGSGDSGSPILTADGKVVGALCYGFQFSNNQFAARAIEDMLAIGESSSGKSIGVPSLKSSSNLKPIEASRYMTGIDANVLERYQAKIGDEFLSSLKASGNIIHTNKTSNELDVIEKVPGMSIAVTEISGDLFTVGAVGTLSYITTDNKLLAFGHGYGDAPMNARTTTANMVTMINSELMAYKIAIPSNNTIGFMTVDNQSGILIDPTAQPKDFTHSVTINLSGSTQVEFGSVLNVNHSIAQYKDAYYDTRYSVLISALTVYNKILSNNTRPLKADCHFTINFKNIPDYTDSLTVANATYVDEDIYYQLSDEVLSYLLYNNAGNYDNIEDFDITIDISDWDGEYDF